MDSLTGRSTIARKKAYFLAEMSQNYLAARNQARFLAVQSTQYHHKAKTPLEAILKGFSEVPSVRMMRNRLKQPESIFIETIN